MPEQAASKALELAYDAGQKALAAQDGTLGSVRTRANNLLATSALFTSVSTAIGLINTDPDRGAVLAPEKALALIAVVAVLGICVVFVLWPIDDWQFGPDPQQLLDKAGDDEASVRKFVIEAMITALGTNGKTLKSKQTALRLAAGLLVVEVLLLVLFLSFWK